MSGGRIQVESKDDIKKRLGGKSPDAADAALDGVWRLFVASLTPSSALYGAQPLLFVHDSNLCQVRTERAAGAKVEQERLMKESFGRWCPDVPVKVKTTVTDRYVK